MNLTLETRRETPEYCENCGAMYYDPFHGLGDCVKHLKETIEKLVEANELYTY